MNIQKPVHYDLSPQNLDMVIGLIGNGFVGSAIYENLKDHYDFCVYDNKPDKSNCGSVQEVVQNCDIIFVALPTPMFKDGSSDLSIIFNVMGQISDCYRDNIIIIKSTVVPGTCAKIQELYPNLKIVFSPEFLTEANHIEDFKNCNRMIFGGHTNDTFLCVKMLSKAFPDKLYYTTDWTQAELVKYFTNTFLATKVSFANEMKQICDALDTSYDSLVRIALYDDRIGKSHFNVPGPDGHHGFGGKCFPKDLNALIHFCLTKDVEPVILKAAWEKNMQVRQEHDWLNIEGAVTLEEE